MSISAVITSISARKHGFDDQPRPWIVFVGDDLLRDDSGMTVFYRNEGEATAAALARSAPTGVAS